MFVVKYYIAGAIASLTMAILIQNWFYSFIFSWISVSLIIVSIAYLFDVPSMFRKRADGSIPFYIMGALMPFFLGAQLYNSWARRNDTVPAIQEVVPNLFLACRLFPSDIELLGQSRVFAILDATSEFSGLDWSTRDNDLAYINVPILDHSTPHKEDLQKAIGWISNQINNDRGVVVHCALGRGRSVFIVAAYLLASGKLTSVDEALTYINKIRGTAQLNKQQHKKLTQMHSENLLSNKESVLLIVNPVSGGGSWTQKKDEIQQRLSVKFKIDYKVTSEELSAHEIAKAHLNKPYTMIVACGGDGTVNEVARALIDTQAVMGIIPLGTTNALAHVVIGNRSKLNPIESACDDIMQGTQTSIDTAICNDDVLLLIAGVGFEQKMITSANRENKNEGGELAYIEGLGAALKENDSKEYEITFDNLAPKMIKASSIVVANAAPFTTILAQGGPEPDPTDGMLDVTILDTDQNLTAPLLTLLTKSITRKLDLDTDIEGILVKRVKKIGIKQVSSIDYVIDGEVRKSRDMQISVNANSLRIAHTQQFNGN